MDHRNMEGINVSETIETEVIGSNNMLTLITTENGIPTSTDVTVLTTTLGDVPIMTASLGTLSEVPHASNANPPTFVTSGTGARNVFTTSFLSPHQAVVLSNGQIAMVGPDGIRRAILVQADAATFSGGVVSQPQNVVTLNLQGASASAGFGQGTAVVLTEEEASSLTHEGQVLEGIQEVSTEVIESDVNTLVQEGIIIEAHEVESAEEASQLMVAESKTEVQLKSESGVTPFPITGDNPENADNTEVEESKTGGSQGTITQPIITADAEIVPEDPTAPEGPPPPPVPDEVICLVCYQAFQNPKKKKKENEDGACLADPLEENASENTCYGKTLGKFFEISRINMSIVTRRSYKDYEVPICDSCIVKLDQAESILEELKLLEKKLYFLRQEIKEEIVASHSFFKKKENKELTESRRKIEGLVEILDVVDRIREDIINDGRPPRIPKSMSGGKRAGRKPKQPVNTTEKAAAVTETQTKPADAVQSESEQPGNTGNENATSTLSQEVSLTAVPETASSSQCTEIVGSQEVSQSKDSQESNPAEETEEPKEDEEEKEVKSAIRTSFGRLVKRPAYMVNEATDDELSELGESSEDNYEEIEVKPEILTEGERSTHEDNEDEVDEEDPAWSPGRGAFITESIGIDPTSSEESEYASDASEIEGVPKKKVKKESKTRKPRKRKSTATPKRQKGKTARGPGRQENVNYEVKVIQLDGTELMTINTSGEVDGIGLEPEITQKVMDSQAVIVVKNQLFGKRVQCPHCPRTFTDPARRDVHVKKNHEGLTRPFECEVCQKKFARQDHLRNHMKRHTRPAKEKLTKSRSAPSEKNQCCEYCDQRFRNKSELIIHTRTHTGERPYKCDHCSEAFVSALKREFHVEQVHPHIPPLRCEFCPKAFFRQHRLRVHAVSHTGEKSNICELCGKSFSQVAMLRYHQTTHEELNLKQFKCQECNRVFANPQNLKSHMESQHQKVYRHRCSTCGRGYTQMSHLRRHLRTHSGEQPFECSYCPKKFTSGAALKIHVRIHTGERPYWCSQCEKGFRSKTKLARHLKTLIHSGEKDKIKKENSTITTEIETVEEDTAAPATTWTEIVGIITGV